MVRSLVPVHRTSSRLFLPTVFALAVMAIPIGCSVDLNRAGTTSHPPIIRARVLSSQDKITLIASQPPVYRTDSDPTPRELRLPKNTPVVLALTARGWSIGSTTLGTGVLTITPSAEGSVAILSGANTKARPYRGEYRFVPVAGGAKFDVINHVDVEGYLAGVLPRELYAKWHVETYKAQAIVSRTYVLYEKAMHGSSPGRTWDVNCDEQSQVYGGMLDETDKSRLAVNQTQGVVVAEGPDGQEPHIFHAFFSSCCGGVSQSAADAFGEAPSEALSERNNDGICNGSPRFHWGPIVIDKPELTRRARAWGVHRNVALRGIGAIREVALAKLNVWGRPTRFNITDDKGTIYSLSAEDFRTACNFDASNPKYVHRDKDGKVVVLFSSFVKVITDSESIRFVEGHGNGHGVGMCQMCSQRRAEEGLGHEDIVISAYPHSKLVHAYQ